MKTPRFYWLVLDQKPGGSPVGKAAGPSPTILSNVSVLPHATHRVNHHLSDLTQIILYVLFMQHALASLGIIAEMLTGFGQEVLEPFGGTFSCSPTQAVASKGKAI